MKTLSITGILFRFKIPAACKRGLSLGFRFIYNKTNVTFNAVFCWSIRKNICPRFQTTLSLRPKAISKIYGKYCSNRALHPTGK